MSARWLWLLWLLPALALASPGPLTREEVPALLRVALDAEAQRPARAPAWGLPATGLAVWLRSSVHPGLRPDAGYESLHDLLHGEGTSARETFADMLSTFLLSRDFSCRQPLLARYLSQRYGEFPLPTVCEATVPFRVLEPYGGPGVAWIDPARVHAIHLLFAGRNRHLASRFGHVALRLVVCPEGRSDADACDSNLAEHLVLGFRAHVDELELDVRRAFTGGYAAHLYGHRFMDVYQEYAIDELREISSLPLRLDEARRGQMVRELAELQARYGGRYRYVTANCATLLQRSLRLLWPEMAGDRALAGTRLRPDTLFASLRRSPLAEGERLADPARAEREGYYFPSTRRYYDQAATLVRAAMAAPGFDGLDGFLRLAPGVRAAARDADPAYRARLAAEPRLREAQVLLEEYAMLRSERLLKSQAARFFLQEEVLAAARQARAVLPAPTRRIFDDCLWLPLQQRAAPTLFPGGIPRRDELPLPQAAAEACASAATIAALRPVFETVLARDPAGRARLLAIMDYRLGSIANVEALLAMAPPPP